MGRALTLVRARPRLIFPEMSLHTLPASSNESPEPSSSAVHCKQNPHAHITLPILHIHFDHEDESTMYLRNASVTAISTSVNTREMN
jgi:hypothetical protein